jgi:hypothetical protein
MMPVINKSCLKYIKTGIFDSIIGLQILFTGFIANARYRVYFSILSWDPRDIIRQSYGNFLSKSAFQLPQDFGIHIANKMENKS